MTLDASCCSDRDYIQLMFEKAVQAGSAPEVLESYNLYRAQGETERMAAALAMDDWEIRGS